MQKMLVTMIPSVNLIRQALVASPTPVDSVSPIIKNSISFTTQLFDTNNEK